MTSIREIMSLLVPTYIPRTVKSTGCFKKLISKCFPSIHKNVVALLLFKQYLENKNHHQKNSLCGRKSRPYFIPTEIKLNVMVRLSRQT